MNECVGKAKAALERAEQDLEKMRKPRSPGEVVPHESIAKTELDIASAWTELAVAKWVGEEDQ